MKKGYLIAGAVVLVIGIASWWYYGKSDANYIQPENKVKTASKALENLLEQRLIEFPEKLLDNEDYLSVGGTREYYECVAQIKSEKFGFTYSLGDTIKLKQNDISCLEAQIFSNDIVGENETNFFISGQYIVDFIEQYKESNPENSTLKMIEEANAYSAIKNSEGHNIFMGGHYLPAFIWAGGNIEYANNNIDKHPRDLILSLKPIEDIKEIWAWF